MSDSRSLAGRTAVVTGASSGIGRALAGRTRAPMEESRKKIEEAGGRAHVAVADLRDVAQVQGLVDSAVRETGRLDIMVNNAGVSYPAPICEGDPEEWRAMFETNVLALLVGSQAAVRAMRACGATKHAVNCISASLRAELENDNIRVVNVMPGAIATNFARNFDPAFVAGFAKLAGMEEVEVKRGEHLPDEVFEKLSQKLKQLLGDPDDVANAVLYAVRQPIHVNLADIVVRPPKQLNL